MIIITALTSCQKPLCCCAFPVWGPVCAQMCRGPHLRMSVCGPSDHFFACFHVCLLCVCLLWRWGMEKWGQSVQPVYRWCLRIWVQSQNVGGRACGESAGVLSEGVCLDPLAGLASSTQPGANESMTQGYRWSGGAAPGQTQAQIFKLSCKRRNSSQLPRKNNL